MSGTVTFSITPKGAAMLALGDAALAGQSAARDRLALFNEGVWLLRLAPADAAFVLGIGTTELRDMLDGRTPIHGEVWQALIRAIEANIGDLQAIAADLRAAS